MSSPFGELFYSKIFGLEDKQQSRLPVTQEITGPAPVRTAMYVLSSGRRHQTVNLT